jgi:hypothetical protein
LTFIAKQKNDKKPRPRRYKKSAAANSILNYIAPAIRNARFTLPRPPKIPAK